MNEYNENASKNRLKHMTVLCQGLEEGMTFRVACDFADITYVTAYKYIKEEPIYQNMVNLARAKCVQRLLPKVEEKDPWKLLKSIYKGEYVDDPSVQLNVNVDQRPLIDTPSEALLKALAELESKKEEPKQVEGGIVEPVEPVE